MLVGGQRHVSAALSLGNTRFQLYRVLVGAQGQCELVRKISPLKGFDPRNDKPVDSRYTDWAMPGLV